VSTAKSRSLRRSVMTESYRKLSAISRQLSVKTRRLTASRLFFKSFLTVLYHGSMLFTRERLEQNEHSTLAPYASLAAQTRGRVYPEEESTYRTAYQKDRDRVIHSSAFRRLEYKTQVFVNYEGDYYRTRLTHTLEVAQVSKSIARALGR
jgi:hypothetical protein